MRHGYPPTRRQTLKLVKKKKESQLKIDDELGFQDLENDIEISVCLVVVFFGSPIFSQSRVHFEFSHCSQIIWAVHIYQSQSQSQNQLKDVLYIHKSELAGIGPAPRLPYPNSEGISNLLFSPTHMSLMPCSQPWITRPAPSWKLIGTPRS